MDILQKRNELFSAMKALNNTIVTRSIKGENCNEEQGQYAELETKFQALTVECERQNKFRSFEQDVNKAIDSREITSEKSVDEGKFRSAFVDYCRTGNDASLRSMNTYASGEGAALVGQTMYGQLDNFIRGASVVRQLPGVTTIKTSKLVTIPYPATGLTSTITAQAPSASYTETDLTLGTVNLTAYKQGGIIKVSEELLKDSEFDLVSYINQEVGLAVGEKEENLFISGSGTNETRGILRTTSGITDTTINSGSVADGLIDAQFVNSHLRSNGVYIFGAGLAKAARKVKASDGQYLWNPSLVEGSPDRFNGRPVFVTDSAPATLAAGTVAGAYVVPSELVIGDRVPVTVQRLNELYAAAGFVGFKFLKRSDMVLKNTKGLTRLVWA
jgi:HK97 family phage major capsid protein